MEEARDGACPSRPRQVASDQILAGRHHMSRIRVGILFGGRSAEHEVSILSARNILAALDRSRFEPVLVGIDKAGRWLLQSEAALLESARDPRLVRVDARGSPVVLEARPLQAGAP